MTIPIYQNNVAADVLSDLKTVIEAVATATVVTGDITPTTALGEYVSIGETANGYEVLTNGTYYIWHDEFYAYISLVEGSTNHSPYFIDPNGDDEYAASVASGATGTATVTDGSTIFSRVEITSGEPSEKQKHRVDAPLCLIRYQGEEEHRLTDNRRGVVFDIAITISGKTHDESDSVDDLNALVSAVKNVIHTSPPDDARAIAPGGEDLIYALTWGEVSIDSSDRQPWRSCTLPLSVACVIDDEQSY